MNSDTYTAMDTAIQDAINEQIQAEFQSAYIYLAMSAKFEVMSLKGFAHWLREQWREETTHAMKFYDFLLQRDGTIDLKELEKPTIEFSTPLEAFEQVLDHEKYITSRINDLYALATQKRDYPLQNLLQWFIDEQVEEEDSARSIIDSLKLIGGTGPNLFLLDRELGSREAE